LVSFASARVLQVGRLFYLFFWRSFLSSASNVRGLPFLFRMRFRYSIIAALLFVAPFAGLVMLWAALVPYFDVNPRLFPRLSAVVQAGIETIQDGTLFAHIAASLLRVLVGTVL